MGTQKRSEISQLMDLSKKIRISRRDTAAYKLLNLARSGNELLIEDYVLRLSTTLDEEDRKRFIQLYYTLSASRGIKKVAHIVAMGLLTGGEKHGEVGQTT